MVLTLESDFLTKILKLLITYSLAAQYSHVFDIKNKKQVPARMGTGK